MKDHHYFDRFMDFLEEVINTRTILALIGIGGFFLVVFKVIASLSNPPASELFAILNLVFGVSMAGLAYYFGRAEGRRERDSKNGGDGDA